MCLWKQPASDLHTSAFYILHGLAGVPSRLLKHSPLFLKHYGLMVKSKVSRFSLSRFGFQIHHLLAVWLIHLIAWAIYLTALRLSVLIFKMRKLVISTS